MKIQEGIYRVLHMTSLLSAGVHMAHLHTDADAWWKAALFGLFATYWGYKLENCREMPEVRK